MQASERQADLQKKNLLYDFYGGLLTDKQREYFKMHYMEDLSYTEIAAEVNITPQAAADLIKRTGAVLESYESRLGLIKKHQLQYTLAGQINDMLDKLYDNYNTRNVAAIQKHLQLFLSI